MVSILDFLALQTNCLDIIAITDLLGIFLASLDMYVTR